MRSCRHSYLPQQAPPISPIWADNSLATSLFSRLLPRSIGRYYPALQEDIWYDSERIFAQFNALMQKIGSWHSYLSTQQAPDPVIGSIAAIWADNSLATSLFRQILPRSIGRFYLALQADIWYDSERIFAQFNALMQKIGSWHSYLSTQQAPDPEIGSISPIWADNSLATSLFMQILPRSIGRYYLALQEDIWYDSERIFAQFNALMQKIGSWHSYLSTQQAPDPEIGSISPIWADNSLATSLFRQILPRSIGRYYLALQEDIWYDSERIFAQFNALMQKIGSWHSYLSTQQAPDPEIGSISAIWADNSLATSLFMQILPRSIGRYYPALQEDIWYDSECIFAQFNALMQKIGSWHSYLSTQRLRIPKQVPSLLFGQITVWLPRYLCRYYPALQADTTSLYRQIFGTIASTFSHSSMRSCRKQVPGTPI